MATVAKPTAPTRQIGTPPMVPRIAPREDLNPFRIAQIQFGGHVELNLRDAEWIQVLARRDAGHHGGCAYLSCRGCGLCDRGHWRRSFRLRDLSEKLCFHLA